MGLTTPRSSTISLQASLAELKTTPLIVIEILTSRSSQTEVYL